MSWIVYALGAITAVAFSDLFRKLGSNLKDPFLTNLIFQIGAVTMAVILYLIFSRKIEANYTAIMYALVGGFFVSIFTTFFFKSLSLGPGIATVVPVVKGGGVLLVAILGIILFKEKVTWNIIVGIFLACSGLYLLFLNK